YIVDYPSMKTAVRIPNGRFTPDQVFGARKILELEVSADGDWAIAVFCPKGMNRGAGVLDLSVVVWNLKSASLVKEFLISGREHDDRYLLSTRAWISADQAILSVLRGTSIEVWDAKSGTMLQSFHTERPMDGLDPQNP